MEGSFKIRFETDNNFKSVEIRDAADSADYLRKIWNDMPIYESVYVLTLKGGNVTGWVKLSCGGMTKTIIDVRLLCKIAIDSLCDAVIIAHNHPSGQLIPSDADKHMTQKTREALDMFDIDLLDHIILTENGYFAFSEHNLL